MTSYISVLCYKYRKTLNEGGQKFGKRVGRHEWYLRSDILSFVGYLGERSGPYQSGWNIPHGNSFSLTDTDVKIHSRRAQRVKHCACLFGSLNFCLRLKLQTRQNKNFQACNLLLHSGRLTWMIPNNYSYRCTLLETESFESHSIAIHTLLF